MAVVSEGDSLLQTTDPNVDCIEFTNAGSAMVLSFEASWVRDASDSEALALLNIRRQMPCRALVTETLRTSVLVQYADTHNIP